MEEKVNVLWTEKAKSDLKEIYEYLCEEIEEERAFNFVQNIVKRVHQLESFPKSGSIETLLSHLKLPYRKLVEGNCKIIYRISTDKIYINRIFDARQHPNKLKIK